MSAAAETLKTTSINTDTKVLNDNKAQLEKALAELTAIPPTPDELELLENFKKKHDVADSEFHKHKIEGERLFAIAISQGNANIASILIRRGVNIRNPILVGNASLSIIDYLCEATPHKLAHGTKAICELIKEVPVLEIIFEKYYLLLRSLTKPFHSEEDKNKKIINENIYKNENSLLLINAMGILLESLTTYSSDKNINLIPDQCVTNIIETLSSLTPGQRQNSLFIALGNFFKRLLIMAISKGIPQYKNAANEEIESEYMLLLKRIRALSNGNEYALLALESILLELKSQIPTHSKNKTFIAPAVVSKKQFDTANFNEEEQKQWNDFLSKIPENINGKQIEKPPKAEDCFIFAFQIKNYTIINLMLNNGFHAKIPVPIDASPGSTCYLPLSALCLAYSLESKLTLEHLKCLKLLLQNNAEFDPETLPLHKMIMCFCRRSGNDFDVPSAEIAVKMIQMLLEYGQNPNIRNAGNQRYSFFLKKTSMELVIEIFLICSRNPFPIRSFVLQGFYLKKILSLLIASSKMNYGLLSGYDRLVTLFATNVGVTFSAYPTKVEEDCLHSPLLRDLACQVVKLVEEEYNKVFLMKKESPRLSTATVEPLTTDPTPQRGSKTIEMESLVNAAYAVITPDAMSSIDILYSNKVQNDQELEYRRRQTRVSRSSNFEVIPEVMAKFNESIFRYAAEGLTDAYNFGSVLAATHPTWQPKQVGTIVLDYYMGAGDIYSNENNPFLPSFTRGWESVTQNANTEMMALALKAEQLPPSDKSIDSKADPANKPKAMDSAGGSGSAGSAANQSMLGALRPSASITTASTAIVFVPDESMTVPPIPETTREATRALLTPLLFQMNLGIKIRNHIAIASAKQTKPKSSSP